MDRVYQSSVSGTPPAAPSVPLLGYPRAGDPISGTKATRPGPWWFHMITEELRNIVVAAGVSPDGTDTDQVLQALRAIFNPSELVKVTGTLGDGSGSPFRPSINACIEFSSGHMLQVGGGFAPAAAGATGTLISFPMAFEEACYQVVATDYGAGIPVVGVSTVDGNLAQFRAWAKDGIVGSYQNAFFRYMAFGK
jgi:hypothetical protein